MATRIKTANNVPYDDDFYVWAERQAVLLRGLRFDELDLENPDPGGGGIGRRQAGAVLSSALLVMEHLLKPSASTGMGWRPI